MIAVTILRGLPGTGKTTFAQKQYDRNPKTTAVVSADLFFCKDGEYRFDAAKLTEAHEDCFRAFVLALSSDKVEHVIVDNTNVMIAELAPYVMYANAICYADVRILEFEGSFPAMLNKNWHLYKERVTDLAFRNVHGINASAIDAMCKKWQEVPSYWKPITRDAFKENV